MSKGHTFIGRHHDQRGPTGNNGQRNIRGTAGERGQHERRRKEQRTSAGLAARRRHIHADRRCGETKPIPVRRHRHDRDEHEKR
jgi:hypothetical protein